MYKNATYKEKFADLQAWLPHIMESVKKDLKNEHLRKDAYFVKKFLSSKNFHKATTNELATAYQKAIQDEEKGEELGEFIAARWLLKHSELYDFFEKQLSQISPDITALEEINQPHAQALIEASVDQFGLLNTYLFAVLNSVVLPRESFQSLKAQAQEHHEQKTEEEEQLLEQQTIDQMRKNYERESARLTDKYEKKLSGLQKKYLVDVEALKKQISQLQRKLQEKSG